MGIRDTTSSMSSNTTSKTIVTIRVVKAIVSIVRFRFSGAFSTESEGLTRKSGATVSGPLEGRGVAYHGVVAVIPPGFGGGDGSQSGQLQQKAQYLKTAKKSQFCKRSELPLQAGLLSRG